MTRETRKPCRVCSVVKPLRDYHKKRDNRDGHSHICKMCDSKRHAEARENNQNADDSDKRCWRYGGPWLIINDPDDSWTRNSSLSLQHLRLLLEMEYVCPGLRLRHEKTGRVAEVVKQNGGLQLRYREGVRA